MRRLFTSQSSVKRGSVYREFGGCNSDLFPYSSSEMDSSGPCGVCISTDDVAIIPTVGCSEFTQVTSNNYARLPSSYIAETQVDSNLYDSRWELIQNPFTPVDPNNRIPPSYQNYPDLWSLAGDVSVAFQDDIAEDTCYCPGGGVSTPIIDIGHPRFSELPTIPFFLLPDFFSGPISRIREINPDGPELDGGCCPTEDRTLGHIKLEVIDGELRLTRREKKEPKHIYRADDTDPSFQIVAGYPRKCCIKDEFSIGASSGSEEYVLRDLHFPRWPGPNSLTNNYNTEDVLLERDARQPYLENNSSREEPLGIIPVVVDIQCDPADGKVYIYWANIVVHDGIIAGLQWDVDPPRDGTQPPSEAPIPPEDLAVNKDYQGSNVWPDFTPISQNEPKPWREETCSQAVSILEGPSNTVSCEPGCPNVCSDYSTETQFVSIGYGITVEDAGEEAMRIAIDIDAPANCYGVDLCSITYWTCYTVFDENSQMYKSAVSFCCPSQEPSSSYAGA